MGLNTALVDRARVVTKEPTGVRVEGTTVFQAATGQWFRARLTLQSSPGEPDAATGVRVVTKTPLLLYGPKDLDGELVVVTVEDRIEVDSPQLGREVYDVTGDPEPLRKKRTVIGWQAPLRRRVTHTAEAA